MAQLLNIILGIPLALAQTATTTAAKNPSQLEILINNFFGALPYWFTGILVIVFSFVLAKIAKSSVENKMTREGIEEEHQEVQIVAGRATSAIVLTIGITAGLKIMGLDLTPIIAAGAFGVGFAAQDIIMNFFAGIIVLLQKRFTIGDWVKVNGTEGIIKEIQSRYTVIKKFNGTSVIVPNAELFKHQVNSFTANPTRRYTFNIGVDLYADLKEVIETIYKSIDKCPKILKKPHPSIVVTPPGKFYNNIKIRVWVEARKGVLRPVSALMRQIHKDFYRKGWSWPYPTQTLIFDKDAQPDVNQRAKFYVDSHKRKKKVAPVSQPASQANIQQLPPIKVTVDKEVKNVQTQPAAQTQPAPANPQSAQMQPPILNTNSGPSQNLNSNPTLEQNLNPPAQP